MFFSYTVSVLLLSLAMYGMGCALYDLWKWWIGPRFFSNISCSFLVLAGKDGQDTVDLLQYILRETEMTEMECDVVVILESCQRRIKFDRNAGWKLTHFAGGLKRRILLTPVRVSPVYPWWRYQPVAQSLSQLLTYPLICKFRREY